MKALIVLTFSTLVKIRDSASSISDRDGASPQMAAIMAPPDVKVRPIR